MYSILFVCTGNTCRSPMAEWMMRQLLHEVGIAEKVQVLSAGLSAGGEQPMSPQSMKALERRGIALDGVTHASRGLHASLVHEADLILTMTMAHKRHLISLYPGAVDKVFTLREYVSLDDESAQWMAEWQALTAEEELEAAMRGGTDLEEEGYLTPDARRLRLEYLAEQLPSYDIEDPYGGLDEDYEIAAAQIEAACEQVAYKLRRELAEGDGRDE